MPTLDEMVVEFVRGVGDMTFRDNVIMSVRFLRDVYSEGRAKAEDIVGDLKEICAEVLRLKFPDWTEEQILSEADSVARQWFRIIGVEAMAKRLRVKYTGFPF
ncbi:MAG: hypothetical protein QXH20_00405 [Candidatus Bathyarchaeia archaeon]